MIGAILAGGRATRLGGSDKGLRPVGGRPILARVISTLRSQCDHLVLNANGDATRFAEFGLPVVADSISGFPGPLAGILASLEWAATCHPDVPYVVVAPADTPFLPEDLVRRLQAARELESATILCASSGGRIHPVVSLWSVALREDLRRAVTKDKVRKVGHFIKAHAAAVVAWPSVPFDPFFNVNTAADLETAETMAKDIPSLGKPTVGANEPTPTDVLKQAEDKKK